MGDVPSLQQMAMSQSAQKAAFSTSPSISPLHSVVHISSKPSGPHVKNADWLHTSWTSSRLHCPMSPFRHSQNPVTGHVPSGQNSGRTEAGFSIKSVIMGKRSVTLSNPAPEKTPDVKSSSKNESIPPRLKSSSIGTMALAQSSIVDVPSLQHVAISQSAQKVAFRTSPLPSPLHTVEHVSWNPSGPHWNSAPAVQISLTRSSLHFPKSPLRHSQKPSTEHVPSGQNWRGIELGFSIRSIMIGNRVVASSTPLEMKSSS